jgi:hypothetical protein
MYTVYTDPSGGGWTDMRDIYPITSLLNGSYCIGITPTGNASVFVSNNTLVYNVSCQGHTYHATAWPEARVCLGYSNVCNSDNAKNDTDIFWNQMNKGVYRDVGHARTLLNIECDGNKATTVGLMVDYARDLATGSQLFNAYQVPEGGLNVRIRFDTQVTQSDQPILTTGRLNSTGAVWENDSTLQVHVGVNGIGYGDLQILASKITSYTNNSIHLDGNGAGPSGDNFTVRLCNNDCPAAAVGGFTVSGTTASWYVDTEDNTASYSIEGSNDTNGPWSSLTTVGAGVGQRSCTIPSGNSAYYRLVENETTGQQIVHGTTTATRPAVTQTLNQNPSDEELRAMLDQLQRQRSSVGLQSSDGERVLICSPSLFSGDLNYLTSYLTALGYPVDVRLVDGHTTDTLTFQSWLDDQILQTAATKVMLIGDANDWRQFSNTSLWPNEWAGKRTEYLAAGYPSGGQPANDLIPSSPILASLPRGQNMAWVTPYYFSDQKYVEHWPEVTLTRLPVSSSSELLAWVYKMQGYNQGYTGVHGYNVTTYVGDRDYDTAGDGLVALDAMNQTIAALPSGQRIASLAQSQSPIDWQRTQQASTLWATNRTEVAVLLSSASNRGWPGNYFDQTIGFNVGMLDDYHAALVMANSCDGGDFIRTEDPHYGTPVCEKFLFDWSRGAVAWIGPTAGTWQVGNKAITQYLIQEIVGHPSRSMADGFRIAVQRVRHDYADAPDVLQTLDSYVFLGDPVSPLRHVISVSGAPDDHGGGLKLDLAQNAPNPFNPKTTISFTLPTLSPVSLRVYNVQGEAVRPI